MAKTPSKRKRQPPATAKPDFPAEAEPEPISAKVLAALPDETRIAYVQSISFRGPLPPPALLEDYDKVKPGLADTITAMAQAEQNHRHIWEASALNAHHTESRLGQWLGFGIAGMGMVSAVVCAYLGQPVVAVSSLVPVVAGILTYLLKSSSHESA